MRGVNKVVLIGHLGKDPEVRYLEGGTTVANFSLATTEVYKNKKGERVDKTEWHKVTVWRKLAEIVEQFVRRGSFVYLEGQLRTRSWEDKNGLKRYTTEVIADNLVMLDRKKDKLEDPPKENENAPVEESVVEEPADDLPF